MGKFRPIEYQKKTTTKEYQRAFEKDKETA